MINFSYCLDAADSLIRLDLRAHPDALIPGSVIEVTSADEQQHPLPWTKTQADAIREVRFVPRPHVIGTHALAIQETGVLPKADYVFVPPSNDYADDEQIREMITLYDSPEIDSVGREQIADGLAQVGVQLIPFIASFTPTLHTGTCGPIVNTYTAPGWISHTKVYRKATVA